MAAEQKVSKTAEKLAKAGGPPATTAAASATTAAPAVVTAPAAAAVPAAEPAAASASGDTEMAEGAEAGPSTSAGAGPAQYVGMATGNCWEHAPGVKQDLGSRKMVHGVVLNHNVVSTQDMTHGRLLLVFDENTTDWRALPQLTRARVRGPGQVLAPGTRGPCTPPVQGALGTSTRYKGTVCKSAATHETAMSWQPVQHTPDVLHFLPVACAPVPHPASKYELCACLTHP